MTWFRIASLIVGVHFAVLCAGPHEWWMPVLSGLFLSLSIKDGQ